MRAGLILTLFIINVNKLLPQARVVGDSMRIVFPSMGDQKLISSQKDLEFTILLNNIANKPISVYKTLWYSRMPSPLANYDCMLYSKSDTGFIFVDHYIYEPTYPYFSDSLRQIYSDSVAESLLNAFDLHKDTLGIGYTDTLRFNLLSNNIFLDAGEYKMRIAFRIGNEYEETRGSRRIARINYVYSEWYYFRLNTRLIVPLIQPD